MPGNKICFIFFRTTSPILATAFLENDNGLFVLTEKELIYEPNLNNKRESYSIQATKYFFLKAIIEIIYINLK